MTKKINLQTSLERREPKLSLRPDSLQQGDVMLVSGTHWPFEAIQFRIGKKDIMPVRILQGNLWNGYLVPDSNGNFQVEFPSGRWKPGKYQVEAFTIDGKLALSKSFQVDERAWPGKNTPRPQVNKFALRQNAFDSRRFNTGKGLPQGLLDMVRLDWERIHRPHKPWDGGGIVFFTAPVPGLCNWTPLGPAPFTHGKGSMHGNNSGRIRSLAIHPVTPAVMFAGTAGGGVWKSEDAGVSWVPKTDNQFSMPIGSIAIDPVTPSNVYAGTGEYVPGTDTHYYGNGLLKSIDSGNSWTEIGTLYFSMSEISRIVIDPLNNARIFVAASNGIWISIDSGMGWTQISASPATDIILVRNPGEPGVMRLFAGFTGLGIQTATSSGMGWSAFAPVAVPGAPVNPARTVFGVCRTLPQHIYASFSQAGGGNMLAHIARSSNYGTDWSACTIPDTMLGRIYQAYYNMAIQPHPTDPETVLLAMVDVFKSIDGGGTWTNVSFTSGPRVHADCHAIAFSPTDSNQLYLTSDGGIYYSPDLTASWQARNQDISTIQFYDFGQHPQYESILIAGAQDNGGFHYSGAPIWRRTWVTSGTHNAMDGDAVVATIDPFNPYYHYYGTGPEGHMLRSDDAGRLFTTSFSKPPGSPWWTPFFPDPRTAGVLYMGGTTIVRSDDRGTTWTDIATGLPSAVRAIGFHPTDPLVLYAGTLGGQVYRLQGPPMGPWNTGTVTLTNVTYSGLPVSKQISGLAVDPAGNVWASFSSLLEGEDPGEFSNQHVFRLDAGAGSWTEKSNGLSIANPVNTIVIDPLDANAVYCGADRGVYAWNAGSQSWMPFDRGLPNAPVMVMKIHEASRKLRVATYGRGLWEFNLNPAACSDYFLYMRNHIADAGAEPAADGVAHPYRAGYLCWHWQSPDIIVDPANQTLMPVSTALELADKVLHYGGRRGTNRVYITVHNKGPFRITNVRVRVFFASASGGLPAFPAGLLTNPFTWMPVGAVAWNPVGASVSIPSIEPGTTRLAVWPSFVIPMSAPQHSCLMAFVTSDEDPFVSGGITNPDELVISNRKVALKNLDLDGAAYATDGEEYSNVTAAPASADSDMAADGFTPPRMLVMNSSEKEGTYYQPGVYCASLPEDAVLIFATDPDNRKRMKTGDHKVTAREKKAAEAFAKAKGQFRQVKEFDLRNVIVREARAGETVSFGDLFVSKAAPVQTVVWVWSKKWDAGTEYGFDVLQSQGQRSKGGFTVSLGGMKR